MTKYATSKFYKSFSFAIRGIFAAIKSQQNFRIQLSIGFFAYIAAFFLKFSIVEFCILSLVIAMVLLCELFNSVIEFTLDAVYKNKYSKLVELAKDMAAGAVLISTFFSIVIGIMLFVHRIIYFLH